jgi:hypothetical protein
MSEYGIKIKNIEGASLYENNIGVRNHFDYKDAMLTNSLFHDFLKANGLNVYKGKSTRDIICIEFNFGTRSYEEEIKHIEKMIEKTKRDTSLTEENREQKLLFFDELKKEADRNKDKYKKITKEELREELYTNGVDVKYITRDKKGNVKKEEVLHYKMLYRSTGKAKKGSCMFIIDELYDKAVDFLRMGIKLPKEQAKIVEISAYSPLVSSTIVGKIHIEPENILILKDVDSFCKKDVVSVELDAFKHCIAKRVKDYELTSVLFDGQALIDYSVFPSWGNGYVLLRHHFFKCASFKTNIQGFFRDYYGDEYETAKITDMFGVEHYAKDIKLITTDNACKWIKFSIPYEYWCQKVHENNSMFGVVKTAHKSKLGDVQQMSYQMVNSLNLGSMDKVVKDTMDYIMLLKKDDDVFLDYLEMNKNFSNDFEVLIALVKQNREFIRSEYFRSRRYKIIENYIKSFRQGKIIQNADNLVLVGNPYGMLMYTVGLNPEEDPTLNVEDGVATQCYTNRFDDGEYLAEFRSPFNGLNNMGYLHNVKHPLMDKYFDFGEMIIAVNCIHTDFQSRNNGSDFDSDSIYTTNQPQIVDRARQCVEQYHTIENNIPKSNKTYNNTLLDFANMDNNLAKAQLAIGSSSNLAQICLTYMYNFDDQKYEDYLCILSVLA